MIKGIFIFILIWLAGIFQVSFFGRIDLLKELNPLLLIVIWVSIFSSPRFALPVILIAGLSLDSASYMPVGTYLACFCIIWLAVRGMERGNFASLSLMSVTIMTAASSLLFSGLVALSSRIWSGFITGIVITPLDKPALLTILIGAAVNGVVMGIFFGLASRVSKRFNLSFITQYKRAS